MGGGAFFVRRFLFGAGAGCLSVLGCLLRRLERVYGGLGFGREQPTDVLVRRVVGGSRGGSLEFGCGFDVGRCLAATATDPEAYTQQEEGAHRQECSHPAEDCIKALSAGARSQGLPTREEGRLVVTGWSVMWSPSCPSAAGGRMA